MLNHEGSVADCASVAGLAALAHFRRPDVTLQGDIVQVTQLMMFGLERTIHDFNRCLQNRIK